MGDKRIDYPLTRVIVTFPSGSQASYVSDKSPAQLVGDFHENGYLLAYQRHTGNRAREVIISTFETVRFLRVQEAGSVGQP